MSLQKGLEQIEPWLRKNKWGNSNKSSKWWKKFRNRWLRRYKKTEIPPTRLRKGYEF